MSDELFDEVDRQAEGGSDLDGEARLETANRTQVELTPTDLATVLPPGHAARVGWRFVEGLDLSALTARIRSREGRAGRPAIAPKILVARWLYATIDGVGSARELDRLCYAHDAYRWLRGGVSVNYHTLSRFRVGYGEALDARLTQSITVRLDKQVVTLNRMTQDGTKSAARVSTTDPDARVMKMADGGYRPAYNVPFATDVDGQAVVGVAVTNGGEQAELVPMLDQVQARTPRRPGAVFADGGVVSTAGILGVAARGVPLYAPVSEGKHAPGLGEGPRDPRSRRGGHGWRPTRRRRCLACGRPPRHASLPT